MKIIIPATAINVESNLDLKFGKCKYFCIYDSHSDKVEFIKNNLSRQLEKRSEHLSALLKEWEIDTVVTTNIGPNMISTLESEGIKIIVLNNIHQPIQDVISKFKT
ncbi:MAG: NifB/NifX family molybdenum-iron cluster-binding protein [Bacteroidales bacterium]